MVEYDSFSALLAMYNSPILTQISLFMDVFVYPLILIFLAYLFFIKKDKKRALVIGLTYLVLILVIPVLKSTFSEERPCSAPWKIDCPTDNALPSGHAAAMAVLMIAYLTSPMFPFALLAYAVVSLSRIYLGIHVFKDILAGMVIAFSVFLFIEKSMSRTLEAYLRKRDKK